MRGDPERDLPGTIAVVAPHMDDELIGCGGLLATEGVGRRAHVIYASDGSRSPTSPYPWRRTDRSALARAREEEARAGLAELGLPSGNAHFLGLPDGSLHRRRSQLEQELALKLATLDPDHLLVPFRMDFHPDHMAVATATRNLLDAGRINTELLEYFAYARWKLLPGRDIRGHIRDGALLCFDLASDALARKRRAFLAHSSQTSRFYPWQKRVNLTPEFVDVHCTGPEFLVRAGPGEHPDAIFTSSRLWIHTVHAVEPRLKRAKDLVLDLLRG
jgi:LmbE family N-acetylglucosaminyl deacetylase